MKKILIGLVVVIVIIIAGAVYLFGQLDSLVAGAIEKYGSQVTQTNVAVSGVNLELAEGKGSIQGLQVGNPKGFDTDYAFRLNEISMSLDVQRISKELIVVKEIVVDGPTVIYELSKGGSNIDAIKNNVTTSAGSGSGSSSDSGSGPKLIIDNLIIRNADMKVSSSMVKGKTLSTTIPTIHLTDIGKQEGGATPAEVARKIFAVLASKAGSAAGKLDLSALMDAEALKGMGVDKAKEMGGEQLDKLKGAGSGATEKLKELF